MCPKLRQVKRERYGRWEIVEKKGSFYYYIILLDEAGDVGYKRGM
jgi:hypothetical protein